MLQHGALARSRWNRLGRQHRRYRRGRGAPSRTHPRNRPPGLGAVLPVLNRCTLLMDVGGTVRCKPVNLLQFAQMGSIYMKLFRNVENPSVRLLSNGEEATKGDEVISAARALIEQTKLNLQGTPRARTSRRESRTSSSATASPATSSSNSERGSASLSRASSKKNINTICFRKSDASSCSPR